MFVMLSWSSQNIQVYGISNDDKKIECVNVHVLMFSYVILSLLQKQCNISFIIQVKVIMHGIFILHHIIGIEKVCFTKEKTSLG